MDTRYTQAGRDLLSSTTNNVSVVYHYLKSLIKHPTTSIPNHLPSRFSHDDIFLIIIAIAIVSPEINRTFSLGNFI
ncbi:hypothetical protein BHYA_0088g00280 [Botrytis hyacinthi]|uniref:Uncharacterized protein n=1 Tax=Botrytis hyacinthi TaxID=278943 RepID=A0A4Z1GSQ4_9HELO|nr:hypothetical protein BHYA_0088g00280 [Botrytis hyacinthi]